MTALHNSYEMLVQTVKLYSTSKCQSYLKDYGWVSTKLTTIISRV